MSPAPLLEINNLSKQFHRRHLFGKESINAVRDLCLSINQGEIFAFLGPNGAGKTTTINMLVGFLRPTSGTINIFGSVFSPKAIAIKRRIGYLPESVDLPSYYRVYELLELYCDLFFIARPQRKERIAQLLHELDLEGHYKKWIKDLSMGQKRCLGLASALVNDPDLLLLDEPTVYLDPIVLEKIRAVLLKLKKQGKTIFMSSHILSEVENLSDRFAIIKEGRLLKLGITQEAIRHRSLEEEFLETIKNNA